MPDLAGVVAIKTQMHGKIVSLPKERRRELIGHVTDTTGAYMLGRYGTWRQLLLDDLIQDLRAINTMLNGGAWGKRRVRGAT